MRRLERRRTAFAGLLLAGVLAVTTTSGETAAQFSDFGSVSTGAGAGVWAPDPPAACWPNWHKKHGWAWFMDWDEKAPEHHKDWDSDDWDRSRSSKKTLGGVAFGGPRAEGLTTFHGKSWPKMKTIYGTVGDDVLDGGNWPQIIMGLAGDDTLNGGNSLDCLVGGPGDDILNGGNSTDILIGGPGADELNGGNGIDILIGDAGPDQLNGGNGPDIILAGKNDQVEHEWWDIVIRINELDDCDGSGGLGGILECFLPDGMSVADAGSLTVLEETAAERTEPKTEGSLLAPDELSEDTGTVGDPSSTEDEPQAQVEDPDSAPVAEGSETVEPDPSTPGDSPPTENSQDQAPAPNPSEASASDGDPIQPSTTTCDGSQPDDQNCEVKP